MELIRNCAHHSSTHVAVYLGMAGKPSRVVKTAFNEEGAKAVKNEHEGLLWYHRRISTGAGSAVNFFEHGSGFARLETGYVNGECGRLGLSIEDNLLRIFRAIDYHIGLFGPDGFRFQHGDYSIENIIFDNDRVAWISDWENFTDLLPKEFDLVYCVMEACFFRYKRRGKLSGHDVRAARELLEYISGRIGLPARCLERPAEYMRDACLNNNNALGSQAMKYPFVNCSPEDIKKIDMSFAKDS